MKLIAKTVTGDEFTFTGPLAADVAKYFSSKPGAYAAPSLGWVSDLGMAVNFQHVVSIRFIPEVTDANQSKTPIS